MGRRSPSQPSTQRQKIDPARPPLTNMGHERLSEISPVCDAENETKLPPQAEDESVEGFTQGKILNLIGY